MSAAMKFLNMLEIYTSYYNKINRQLFFGIKLDLKSKEMFV